MKIHLFSSDEALAAFCRDVVAELFGAEAMLEIGVPQSPPSNGDVCLWDYTPGETPIPDKLDAARHCFLLYRKDLPALRHAAGVADVNVLLKPLTTSTLCAFFSEARLKKCVENGRGSSSLQTLRIERDEILQFLIQANLKLQEYDQERTNFVARSVHELRAPLTAIAGYCSLLLDDELGPLTAHQHEVLGRMQHSAARLSRLAEAMFQLTLGMKGCRELKLECADIRECVAQALHEFTPWLEDKGIAVTVEIEQPPDGLLFEPSQIEQTLVNLLDNACKFTPRDGVLAIRGYPYFWDRRICSALPLRPTQERRFAQLTTPNSMRIDISDSGPGIPAAHLGTIFEEYVSYGIGENDRSGGGLGLAICRMILQHHRGKIWAESRADGALFSFVIPVRRAQTLAVEPGRSARAALVAENGS
jgi:signal transduction histidine kinase